MIGNVRDYEFNPRYPLVEPLKQLLKAAIEIYPQEQISELMAQRTRPRQVGKPLDFARKRGLQRPDS